jgi:hypothetical protein
MASSQPKYHGQTWDKKDVCFACNSWLAKEASAWRKWWWLKGEPLCNILGLCLCLHALHHNYPHSKTGCLGCKVLSKTKISVQDVRFELHGMFVIFRNNLNRFFDLFCGTNADKPAPLLSTHDGTLTFSPVLMRSSHWSPELNTIFLSKLCYE